MPTTQLISDFFQNILGFEPTIEVNETAEEISVDVALSPQDSSLLIGHHGEVLTACQLLLSLMVQKDQGAWVPVRLNINNYRQQRQTTLENLARNVANRVVARQQPMSINHLTSYERRIVHATLSTIPEVATHSEGETPNRVLIVSPVAA